jgi:hypothetical protein
MEDNRKIIDEILESAKQNEYMEMLEDFLMEYAKSDLGDIAMVKVSNFVIYDTCNWWELRIVLDRSGHYYTSNMESSEKFTVDEAVKYVLERENWNLANEFQGKH